ncbi:MAG: hypothetical protein U9R15_09725 [Chloroflexota bacterium]|nr:hypothetical protein [Chloroflexota bacterium]
MGYENMKHVNKDPVPNMVGMRANATEALIMKDMGNGHMRPYLWGTTVTVERGESEALVASGIMAGMSVSSGIYVVSPVDTCSGCYCVAKDTVNHTVKIKRAGTGDSGYFDVLVFMSTATEVDVNDYTGKRGYQSGNY